MLFAGLGSVRMVTNCDLGLENAALGLRPGAAFSRPRSQFFTIRTSQPVNNIYLFAKGEVNIGEYSPRRSGGEYSPMFTESEANNCFSIIFRGEYQGLQNNGLKYKNTDAIVRVHTRTQPKFNNKHTCTSISINLSVELSSKTNKRNTTKINSSGTFVLSLLTSFTVVVIAKK